MPIETITKAGRKRFRWTFDRVIKDVRVRKTKLLPAGTSSAAADKLGRDWDQRMYEEATGAIPAVVTIEECVRLHITDKGAGWKDAKKRVQILEKWKPEYAHQDALELHEWSVRFVGYLRSPVDHNGRAKRALTDGAIRNTLAYIRAAIKYAHKKGKLKYDQTEQMVIPSVNNERHTYRQRREMLEIARACDDREVRAAIRVAFYSGMRRGEILRAIPTKQGYSLGTTKNGRPRIVPIHPRIAVIARKIRFTISVWRFEDAWAKAREKAGYPDTKFHDLRHSAASEMINAGIDLYTVGGVLGHKSSVSTQRYAHLVTERLALAVGHIGKKR